MSNFIDSLKSYVSHNSISKAANLVEEQSSDISSAVESIFSSLMGVLLKYGNSAEEKNILDEAANLNILSNAEAIFDDKQSMDQQKVGDDFLQALLGDKAADFSDAIAGKTKISKVATNKLVSMLAPIFAGFFGKKLKDNNWSMDALKAEIKSQKGSFIGNIPSALFSSFGLSSVLTKDTANPEKKNEKKSSNNWVMWLVLLIAALIVLVLLWRSCGSKDTMIEEQALVVSGMNEGNTANNKGSNMNTNTTNNNSTETKEITLPNGVKLTIKAGGMEDKMITFLNSDEYKNASNNDLKSKWFEFDNIHFAFNSSTELTDESQNHLNNIAEILKAYKNTKVEIGGFADKVGSENVNMEISKQRAKKVEEVLTAKGIGSQIAMIEGFGEEQATRSADAPDTERAKDRDIALRFMK